MAMFEVGDWVEIRSTPDEHWNKWHPVNNMFCGAIGFIREVRDGGTGFEADDEIDVEVDFVEPPFSVEQGTLFYGTFLKKHVKSASKHDAKIRQHMRIAGEKLQEWETFKKQATDDALRKAFLPDPEPEEEEIASFEDEITSPMGLPSPIAFDDDSDPWTVI